MSDLRNELQKEVEENIEEKRNAVIESFEAPSKEIKIEINNQIEAIKSDNSLLFLSLDEQVTKTTHDAKSSVVSLESMVSDSINQSVEDTKNNLNSVSALVEVEVDKSINSTTSAVRLLEKAVDFQKSVEVGELTQEAYFKNIDKDTTQSLQDILRKVPYVDLSKSGDDLLTEVSKMTEELTFINVKNLVDGNANWLKPKDEHFWQALLGALAGGMMGSGVLGAILDPLINRPLQQYMNMANPNATIPIDYLINGVIKRPELQTLYLFEALKLGISPQVATVMQYTGYKKLPVEQAVRLFYRGEIELGEFKNILSYSLYDANDWNRVSQAYKYYPSILDTITFAVKEAFESDDKLFIHDGNRAPEVYYNTAKTVGIDEYWAKKWWHSHWRLLAPEQLFDMHHRGYISYDFLQDYLRRLDYTEIDRKLITQLSYNLMTRVDTRRLFEEGLWNEEETENYFKTLGFSNYDAKSLVMLAKKIRTGGASEIRQLVLQAYNLELIDVLTVKGVLTDTGLSKEEVEFAVEIADYSVYLKVVKEEKELLYSKLLKNMIDKEDFENQMWELGFNKNVTERLIDKANSERVNIDNLPTKAELNRWLSGGIISIDDWVYYMQLLGYSMEVIEWYLMEIISKMEQKSE